MDDPQSRPTDGDQGVPAAQPAASQPHCRTIVRAGCQTPRPTVAILVHGWASSSRFWQHVEDRLDVDGIVLPDLCGFGLSSRAGHAIHLAGHVAQTAALVAEQAATARVVLVGHSYGALVAQDVAVAMPEQVAALVLISSQSRARPFRLTEATFRLVRAIADAATGRAAIMQLLPRYYRPGSLAAATMAELIEDGCRASPDALRESLLSAARAQPLPPVALARARMPVLAMAGEFDLLPQAALRDLAATYAGRAALLPGAGHCAPIDQPEQLAAVLNDFLRSIPGW